LIQHFQENDRVVLRVSVNEETKRHAPYHRLALSTDLDLLYLNPWLLLQHLAQDD